MDFIIGMFLMVFILIMLINFASISVSDSPSVSGQCSIGSWFSPGGTTMQPSTSTTVPKVILNGAMRNNVVSQKMGYDYANYCFM